MDIIKDLSKNIARRKWKKMHLVPAQMSFVPKTQPHILHLVAAGVSPAVEPGILPGGLKHRLPQNTTRATGRRHGRRDARRYGFNV
jgi:hypothetical protein